MYLKVDQKEAEECKAIVGLERLTMYFIEYWPVHALYCLGVRDNTMYDITDRFTKSIYPDDIL